MGDLKIKRNVPLTPFIESCLRPYWHKLTALFFLSLCWTLRAVFTPYFLKMGVDRQAFLEAFVWISVVWILMEVCMRVQGALLWRVLPSIRIEAREKLLEKVKRYPYVRYSTEMLGSLSHQIVSASAGLEALLSIILNSFIPIGALLICSTALLMSIDIWVGGLFVAWVMIHLAITLKMSASSDSRVAAFAEAKSRYQGNMVDLLQNLISVQLYGREIYESETLAPFQQGEIEAEQASLRYLEKIRLILGLSSLVTLMLTLAVSYWGWEGGKISSGDIILVITLLLGLTAHLWYVSMEAVRFFHDWGLAKEHLNAILSEETLPFQTARKEISLTKGELEIRNLSFRHNKEAPLFQGIHFSLKKGEKLALTGVSGAGKTTLIQLILGHYAVQEGDILIDGWSIHHLSLRSIREAIAFVPQKVQLFERSIEENIRYGNPNATLKEVEEAARLAGCHNFILRQREGYRSHASSLSGGQKQQVALARAFLKPAPLLILDEPTSALDAASEKGVMENLTAFSRDKALLLITHRPQPLEYMDKVIAVV